jgi:CubicO group peptidase (beta-lactamase class C family)
MTTDQLTPAQKAVSGMIPGYFESHGWGFGVGIDTRRVDLNSIGRYGWDGGLGSTWYADPKEDLIGIMMTPHSWTSPAPPDHFVDFWTLTYAAIDD